MKYVDEYRDKALIKKLIAHITNAAKGNYCFMEVCGGHTAAIHRFGIPSLLPENINLISGPGCPVCVTGNSFIDKAIAYAKMNDMIITTFGDLIRVPGTISSLEREKAAGEDIRIVFSGPEALDIAIANRNKKVIFLGIGFETTAPGIAVTIKEAEKAGVANFFLLSAHKVMPPAMEVIIKEGVELNGFICPGHVASITGSDAFSFIPKNYGIGCVVTGFEPVDILQSIYMLVNQVNTKSPDNEIQYSRAVTKHGNVIAQKHMNDVFILSDTYWRGFGKIKSSGLRIRSEYERFDAEKAIPVDVKEKKDNELCICGNILRGQKIPTDCTLFATTCVPENPIGACMVSDEGTCKTYYKYRKNE